MGGEDGGAGVHGDLGGEQGMMGRVTAPGHHPVQHTGLDKALRPQDCRGLAVLGATCRTPGQRQRDTCPTGRPAVCDRVGAGPEGSLRKSLV